MELPFGKCECKDTIIQMNERGECVECNPLCADCLDKDHCLMCEENISRYDEEKKMCVCIDGLYFNESR